MILRMDGLSTEDLIKIISRRDARYDGRFYFGVKTTRIYCRPVCPAQPKPKNILIFRSPSEAEKEGYRPCLRCRPDAAPGSKILQGTANSVTRALRLIEESSLEELDVQILAEKVGMTDRHLRRLFEEHLGASPVEILVTKRLHLAKQLLLETPTSVTEIALASGFKSVRRFNEAFKNLYRTTPTQVRATAGKVQDEFILSLPVRRPFDWEYVLAYLSRHETYGIEKVTADFYTRYVPQAKGYATVIVTYDKKSSALKVRLQDLAMSQVRGVLNSLRQLFDTEHNPEHLQNKKGVRVPGCFDAFEIAISIILSQLVSTAHAKTKLKELVCRYGKKLDEREEVYAFPTPEVLSQARIEDIGVTKTKAQAIRALSSEIATGKISLSASADLALTRKKLLDIHGIGPWTVEMIAMRCLGDCDAFPANDLIVARALQSKTISPEKWTSFRGYLVHTLWKESAKEKVK